MSITTKKIPKQRSAKSISNDRIYFEYCFIKLFLTWPFTCQILLLSFYMALPHKDKVFPIITMV